VPWADDVYQRSRPRTRMTRDDVLALDDYRGLHPELVGLRRTFDEGHMAIVEGVGYPDSNLAHFTAQDVWHTARASGRASGDGWIGRLMEALHVDGGRAHHAVHVGSSTSYALKCSTLAVGRNTQNAPEHVRRAIAAYRPRVAYPSSALGKDLRTAAAILQGDTACRVVSVAQPGYDTHEDQRRRHGALMRDLDRGLSAFLADVRGTSAGDEVVVLVHSELGRSLADNAASGTDHGKAGPVLLLGTPVRGGLFGRHPVLEGADDPAHTTDFRSVYASVLERRFGVGSRAILGSDHAPIGCFA
jgi:uncharacterized protein (DUF1501 family)